MLSIKRFLPTTLMGRSLVIILTPIVLIQIVSAIVFFERHWDTVTRRLVQAVAGDISTLIWMMNTYHVDDEQGLVYRVGRMHLNLEAYFRPGEPLPTDPPFAPSNRLERLLAHALDERVGRPFRFDLEAGEDKAQIQVELRDGLLDVFVNTKRLKSTTTNIFVMWLVGTSIIMAGIAAYFMRQQVRPIRRLAKAAGSFGKGRHDVDLKPSGAREVRQAAHAFLMMRARILRQIGQRTQMLAGVSHDLRTPLTRMKLQLAMMGDGEEVKSLQGDVGEMEKMVDGFLAFARGEGEEAPVPTDLGALIEEIAANANTDRLETKTEGDLEVELRPGAIRRCLTNLVDNALGHGTRVRFAAERRADAVVVTVDDDGPGIDPDSREAVFRAFFRLDASRNPETGGTGLGLTIARDVVRSHGGELQLGDSPMGGLRATLTLPV